MSEENKNPLIEAVLKLQEKMVGYGGKGDPYQGRGQQRFTADSTTPAALRVKPSAPAAPKTTPSTSSSAAAPTPKPTGPVVVPTSAPAPSPEISAAETDDKLSRSAPNAAAAYAARKLNTATTTDNSVAKKISDTAKSTMDSAKEYADAGAEKLESGVESGKKYVKDKISDFMKWLRSEEYRRDMLDANLQEFYGGTAQDRIPMQQRIRNATGSQLGGFGNREVTTRLPADTQGTSAFTGMPKTSAPAIIPPRPAIDTAPKPQPNMALQRQQSGDVAPKVDNSASMTRAKTDFQTRVGGVERQNPILAPGKLEGGNLQMGSRGDSVKELQRKLGVKDDGIFGKDTAAALKAFQQKNNLKVDAIYGKQSASAMNKTSAMDALKKENPVGAALSAKSVTPISPMAGQGSSGIPSATSSTSSSPSAADLDYVKRVNFISKLKNQRPSYGAGSNRELNDRYRGIATEEKEMSNKLIEAFIQLQSSKSSNLFAEAKKAKKLDPVGKEDDDIDNDDVKNDPNDKYLKNRREAISKAVKEAKDPYGELDAPKSGGKAPEMTTKPEYATQSKEQTPNRAAKTSLPKGVSVQKEEVEFSEAELAHIASIVEAVAPTPEDHASNATPENNATGGNGRGSMTEEDVVKRGRGRPKGSKSGSKHGGGGNAGGVTHLVDQIKHAGTRGIADGKGNYMLKHEHGTNKDGSPKVHTAAVPQKAANDFYKAYHNTEKPAAKQDLHDKFVAKHFNISKPQTRGISLASMPRPKS